MTRILVTGANGDIAEAVGRVLHEVLPGVHITGADANGEWPGRFFFDRMVRLPPAVSPDFLSSLHDVSQGFDIVIPTIEPELRTLAQTDVEEMGIPLLRLPDRLVNLFLDKYEASRFFAHNNLPTPRTTLLSEWSTHRFPFCIKPVRGAGGRGFQIIGDESEARELRGRDPQDWLAQEFIEGEGNEYTCAVFNWQGDTRHLTMKRELYGGRTFRAEVCQVPEIDQLLQELVGVTKLEGCMNVQLKLTAGGPKILEINPRLSSTVMMRHIVGFRDCEWWVRSFLGMMIEPSPLPSVGSVIYRTSAERLVPSSDRPVSP
jgi:carbamoyl-phosphate synthase large subunit